MGPRHTLSWFWSLGKTHTACSKSKIRTQTPPDLLEGCASVKTQWYFSLNPAGTSKQQLTFSNSEVRQSVWAPRKGALAIQRLHGYKTTHMGSLCLPTVLCGIPPPHSPNCVNFYLNLRGYIGMGRDAGSHWHLCTACTTAVNSHTAMSVGMLDEACFPFIDGLSLKMMNWRWEN